MSIAQFIVDPVHGLVRRGQRVALRLGAEAADAGAARCRVTGIIYLIIYLIICVFLVAAVCRGFAASQVTKPWRDDTAPPDEQDDLCD